MDYDNPGKGILSIDTFRQVNFFRKTKINNINDSN